MTKRTYTTTMPHSSVSMPDGTTIQFTGKTLVTEDPKVIEELDKIAGKSTIYAEDQSAENDSTKQLEEKVAKEQAEAAAKAKAEAIAAARRAAGA